MVDKNKISNKLDVFGTAVEEHAHTFAAQTTKQWIMKRLGHLLSASSILISVLVNVACVKNESSVVLIPAPESVSIGKGSFEFSPSTVISVENAEQKMAADGFAWLFALPAGFVPQVRTDADDADVILSADPEMEKEAYLLDVRRRRILIRASGIEGFLYALQTLRLSLPSAIASSRYEGNVRWEVPVMTVHDKPRFSHRCLRLDLQGRKVDERCVYRLIDCMAMLKYNHLHLNVGDAPQCIDIADIVDYASGMNVMIDILDNGSEDQFSRRFCPDPGWLEPLVSFGSRSLKDIYYYEPFDEDSADDFHDFLMGLFTSTWIRSCAGSGNEQEQLLPRLAALSEIAWSPKGSKDWTRFTAAVEKFRDHIPSER